MAVRKDDLHERITKLSIKNAELKAKLKLGRNGTVGQSTSKIVTAFFKYGMFAFVALCAQRSIVALAGKTTETNMFFSAIADFNIIDSLTSSKASIGCLVAFAFGVLGIIYGKLQSKLRKRTVKNLHQQIAQLETAADQNRTSSNLTPTGDTNPEDE